MHGFERNLLNDDETYAYVTGYSPGYVSVLSRDSSGMLHEKYTMSINGDANNIALVASGNFAYVANFSSGGNLGGIAMYSVDKSTGQLASLGSINGGANYMQIITTKQK